MNGRQRTLLALLSVCLFVAGFLSCFEWKTIEVPTPISLEAARNPYLAGSRLLTAMGHEVVKLEGLQSLDELPPLDGTLIITTHRRMLTERKSEPLLAWVEKGGHLIVRHQAIFHEDEDLDDIEDRDIDALLDPFGLRAYWVADDEDEFDPESVDALSEEIEEALEESGEDEFAEEFNEISDLWRTGPTRWDYAHGTIGKSDDLEVAFDRRRWGLGSLIPLHAIRGPDGLHLVTLAHGEGYLTAVTDEWFLLNPYLGDLDHAEALVRLARMGDRRGPVHIMLSEGFPGLASQIAKYAMPAAIGLCMLVFAWLWRAAPRFGPIAPDPPLDRRQWIEHLEAVGDFHWRRDRAGELIRSTRSSVLRLIETRHPILWRLSPNERASRIAELCGLQHPSVRTALDERDLPSTEANVARVISNLERIRSSL